MKKLLCLLIVTTLVLTNSFSISFADEIENTETTTLDSSIFENVDYSYLGEECNESNIETNYNLYDELDYHECEAVYVLLSEGNDSTIFINCNVLEGQGNIASNNTIELHYNTNNLRGDINEEFRFILKGTRNWVYVLPVGAFERC